MSSSLVHFVPGDYLRPWEFARCPLLARTPPTYEYCRLILSSLSFFSLASLISSSLLKITGPDVGAGIFFTLVLEEALEIFEMLDLESSAPLSLLSGLQQQQQT